MKREALERILAAAEEGRTEYLDIESEGGRCRRKFLPKERLIVLGGGHISQPVCHIASMLGFDVTVVDDRPAFANYGRFPEVAQVVCDEFRPAIRDLKINENDYVCVVTRGHQWDGECLREILSGTHPSYLGMIGSVRRVKGLYEVLEGEGFDRQVLEQIHSPIGLPIKAVTPAEIGVSICAELVEHRRTHEAAQVKAETASGASAKAGGPGAEDAQGAGAGQGQAVRLLDQTNVDKDLLHFLLEEDAPKAVMLVLGTRGSTPAPSGALMGIDPLGRSRGTIGGGCSEAEVISLGRQIARDGGSQRAFIDMTNEAAEQEGMACGGTMEVLIEAITK